MATLKQIEANRRNSRKSTGPVTPAGKATSSQNAAKTGLYAKASVMKGEKPDDLQSLVDEYYDHHHPDTPELRSIVDQLIQTEWELRRLSRTSAQMWDYQITESWTAEKDKYPMGKAATDYHKAWAFFQRRYDSLLRNQSRLLELLRQHRASPIPVAAPAVTAPSVTPELAGTPSPAPTSTQIGFVPSTPSTDPAVPAAMSDSSRQGRIKNCLISS